MSRDPTNRQARHDALQRMGRLDPTLLCAVIDELHRFDPAGRERMKLNAILRVLGNDAAPSSDDPPGEP